MDTEKETNITHIVDDATQILIQLAKVVTVKSPAQSADDLRERFITLDSRFKDDPILKEIIPTVYNYYLTTLENPTC